MKPAELVERIWERDASLWTGAGEGRWLGWLEEPLRMRKRVEELDSFAAELTGFDDYVLLGMGGSSLGPEVFRRTFATERFHVLDTTHPSAIRALEGLLDLARTFFVVSSKSGTTLETRSHLDFFFERSGGDGARFAAVTDPGSELERAAHERGFRRVFSGEPTIGGRYSVLSPFGLVPAALMRLDLPRLLDRARVMVEACRATEGNPGLTLGLAMGESWREGRDKVCFADEPAGVGLWVEQLLAESTGKEGKGLVPVPGEHMEGSDRQLAGVETSHPYDLGGTFFAWEFATAVAGSIIGINPFDQPNVQEAKDRTGAILERGDEIALEPEGSVEELLSEAREGDYIAILAFTDPAQEARLEPLVERARQTGCVVTRGLGPRYLHSTGQLHKGGPNTGLFIQVVDDPGDELPIPDRPFGFRQLIRAQAAGDYEALKERGRRVARIRLEEL